MSEENKRSLFKKLMEKKKIIKRWCPRCNLDFEVNASLDDFNNCRDNTACPECGLKEERYYDETYNAYTTKWPDPWDKVINIRDAWWYRRE